jgi:hypothetical protein
MQKLATTMISTLLVTPCVVQPEVPEFAFIAEKNPVMRVATGGVVACDEVAALQRDVHALAAVPGSSAVYQRGVTLGY